MLFQERVSPMKKKKKFFTFPILNLKQILIRITTVVLFFCAVIAPLLIMSHSMSADLVEILVHAGSNKRYTPEKINIAKAVLSFSVPSLTFSDPAPAVKNVVLSSPPPEKPTPTPPAENTAQSITYKSAEEKGYKSVDGIYINNQTKKSFDILSLLNKELDLSLSSSPSVLIIHTHTTESYTPSEKYNYTPTETDRTTDLSFNMASVGEVIADYLNEQGINALHDKTINDYPSYSQSYSKSLKLVKSYMEKYPSIKIVIDVHRDAIVTKSGTKMRPLAATEPPCAQVMLVVGTNDSGLDHSAWQTNLSFALKLQHEMNSLHPSLARPINLRRERFNQHLAPYAFILEVGTNGNTLDEAKEGARLFAQSLVSLLKN